jgi:hypothetical protein
MSNKRRNLPAISHTDSSKQTTTDLVLITPIVGKAVFDSFLGARGVGAFRVVYFICKVFFGKKFTFERRFDSDISSVYSRKASERDPVSVWKHSAFPRVVRDPKN